MNTAIMSLSNSAAEKTMSTAGTMSVEFSGGLELLMNHQKRYTVPYPWNDTQNNEKQLHAADEVKEATPSTKSPSDTTLRSLIHYISQHILTSTDRTDLFLSTDQQTVRPGILVLVDDTDWELLGGIDYEVQANDRIVFISTLHGG